MSARLSESVSKNSCTISFYTEWGENMNKYAKFVRNTLSERELLEQLAEECNELAKATLKRIRAEKMSGNVTPTTKLEAWDNFIEEQKDVISVLWLLTGNERYAYIDGYPKYERWAKRLGYKE